MPAPKQRTNLSKLKELYYRNVVYLIRLHIEDAKNLVFHLNNNHSIKLAEELKRVFDCKIITTVHYLEWSLGLSGNRKRFRQILAGHEDEYKKAVELSYQKEKAYFEMVDHIISLSKNTRQIMRDDYLIRQEKITVIYNGLTDGSVFSDKQVLRQKYNLPEVPVILFVGRLDEIKGLTYALQATGDHSATSEAGRLELFSQINSGRLPDCIRQIDEPWQTLIRRCLIKAPSLRIKNVQEAKALLAGNHGNHGRDVACYVSTNKKYKRQDQN